MSDIRESGYMPGGDGQMNVCGNNILRFSGKKTGQDGVDQHFLFSRGGHVRRFDLRPVCMVIKGEDIGGILQEEGAALLGSIFWELIRSQREARLNRKQEIFLMIDNIFKLY